MKKLICIMLCLLVLFGCSNDKNPATSGNVQDQAEEKNQQEDNVPSVENKTYDTYSLFSGVKTKDGAWYYNVPYLNEVRLGSVELFTNSDDWWLATVIDLNKKVSNKEDAVDIIFDIFFDRIEGYFYVDDNGFIESNRNNEIHSGLETIKIEGSVTNGKFEEIGECWVYGYVFMLGDTPAAILGMNNFDKTEEAKQDIMMYVDNMVNSLRVE